MYASRAEFPVIPARHGPASPDRRDLRSILVQCALESPQQTHALNEAAQLLQDPHFSRLQPVSDLCTAAEFVCQRILQQSQPSFPTRDSLLAPTIAVLRELCQLLITQHLEAASPLNPSRPAGQSDSALALSPEDAQSLQVVISHCRNFPAKLDPNLLLSVDFCWETCRRLIAMDPLLGLPPSVVQLFKQLSKWPQSNTPHASADSKEHTQMHGQYPQVGGDASSSFSHLLFSPGREEIISILSHLVTLASASCSQLTPFEAWFPTVLLLKKLTPYVKQYPSLIEGLVPVLNHNSLSCLNWRVASSIVQFLTHVIVNVDEPEHQSWAYHGRQSSNHQRLVGLLDFYSSRKTLTPDLQWRFGLAIIASSHEIVQHLVQIVSAYRPQHPVSSIVGADAPLKLDKILRQKAFQVGELCDKWRNADHPQLKLLELQWQYLAEEIEKIQNDQETIKASISQETDSRTIMNLETQSRFYQQHYESLLNQRDFLSHSVEKEWDKINMEWTLIEKEWNGLTLQYLPQMRALIDHTAHPSIALYVDYASKLTQISSSPYLNQIYVTPRHMDTSKTLLEVITKTQGQTHSFMPTQQTQPSSHSHVNATTATQRSADHMGPSFPSHYTSKTIPSVIQESAQPIDSNSQPHEIEKKQIYAPQGSHTYPSDVHESDQQTMPRSFATTQYLRREEEALPPRKPHAESSEIILPPKASTDEDYYKSTATRNMRDATAAALESSSAVVEKERPPAKVAKPPFRPKHSSAPFNHSGSESALTTILLETLPVQSKSTTTYLVRLLKETSTWKDGSERAMRSFLDSVPQPQLLRILDVIRGCGQKGNVLAMLVMGYAYYNGCGFDQNYTQAVEWWTMASDYFELDSICHLGICYIEGHGVLQDHEKGYELFTFASAHNHARSLSNIGWCYEKGYGVALDVEKAIEYYLKAAQLGDTRAQTNLGFCYSQIEDHHSAATWYKVAASKGDPRSQANLGWCYERGLGVETDYKLALQFYRVASDQNDPAGLTNLACCYSNGIGVDRDLDTAIRYFQRASDLGNEVAKANLAACKAEKELRLLHATQTSQPSPAPLAAPPKVGHDYGHTQPSSNFTSHSGQRPGTELSVPETPHQPNTDRRYVPTGIHTTENEHSGYQNDHNQSYGSQPFVQFDQRTPHIAHMNPRDRSLPPLVPEPHHSQAQFAQAIPQQPRQMTQAVQVRPQPQLHPLYQPGQPQQQPQRQPPAFGRSVPLGPQLTQAFAPLETWDRQHQPLRAVRSYGQQPQPTAAPNPNPFNNLNQPIPSPQYLDEVAAPLPGLMANMPPAGIFQQYLSLAARGDPEAMTNIGWCYEKGFGTAASFAKAVEYYQKAASLGHIRALASLGFCYAYGLGVATNYAHAYELLSRAASQGDLKAITELGTMYENGRGVTLDYAEAARLYRLAAEKGHARALVLLGFLHEHGLGIEKSPEEAYRCYLAAADKHYPPGLVNVGICYQKGIGVAQDVKAAVRHFSEAAKLKDPVAFTHIGYCFANGLGVQKNYEQAFLYFQTAARMGNATAQSNLALCYKYGVGSEKNMEEAVKLLTSAAAKQDSLAQLNLGILYRDGDGVEKDLMKAAYHFSLAAAKGDVIAQMHLGLAYLTGEGVKQDDSKAVDLLIRSTEHGNFESLIHLGWCFENGRGVEQNQARAFRSYLDAFERGENQAAAFLAACFQNGIGVDKSDEQAFKYYKIAAEEGDPIAQEKIGWFYENGVTVPRDEALAFHYYKQAADAGLTSAQVTVALFYKRGVGVESNAQQSFYYVRMAAESGHPQAMTSLGLFYKKGKYVPQDFQRAAELFRAAAEAGDPSGAANYAASLETGSGVELDYPQALAYYQMAAQLGYDKAEEDVLRLRQIIGL